MRTGQITLIVTLVCLCAADVGAATPPTDPAAEPETLRTEAPKVAPSPPTRSPVAEGTVRANPLWAIPLKQLHATRERPLFSPSRKPAPPVVASAPRPVVAPVEKPPEAEPLQLSLVGTVAGEKGALGIFLDKAGGGTPVRLKVGEAHKGWTLRSVGRRDVVLAKGTATTKLAMVAAEPAKSKAADATKGVNPFVANSALPNPANVAVPAAPAQTDLRPPMISNARKGADGPTLDAATISLFKLAK